MTAQEEERRTIARELHDEVGQVLTAIKVELAVAEHAIGAQRPALADARAITERAIHTVRDLSHLLRPPLLDDLGLPDTLEWYVKGFRKRHGILVDFFHDRSIGQLSRDADVAAYRIVQEALTNIVKHANATHCRVTLTPASGAVRLLIEDDGRGFDVAAVSQGQLRGMGLLGIRERVTQLNGTFRIDSQPGHGTRLIVELPRPAAEPKVEPSGPVDSSVVVPSAS